MNTHELDARMNFLIYGIDVDVNVLYMYIM